jgi:hypothetical protein
VHADFKIHYSRAGRSRYGHAIHLLPQRAASTVPATSPKPMRGRPAHASQPHHDAVADGVVCIEVWNLN